MYCRKASFQMISARELSRGRVWVEARCNRTFENLKDVIRCETRSAGLRPSSIDTLLTFLLHLTLHYITRLHGNGHGHVHVHAGSKYGNDLWSDSGDEES